MLRGARRRLDGGLVQIHFRQRQVRIGLEQLLALAARVRLEQRRQRPFADELADSLTDAVDAVASTASMSATADAFGKLRAPRQAVVRRLQGLQRDFGLARRAAPARSRRIRRAKPARKIIQSGES